MKVNDNSILEESIQYVDRRKKGWRKTEDNSTACRNAVERDDERQANEGIYEVRSFLQGGRFLPLYQIFTTISVDSMVHLV